MVITKGEAQKKKARYNIYLNLMLCVWCRRGNGCKVCFVQRDRTDKEQIEEIKHDDCIPTSLSKKAHCTF